MGRTALLFALLGSLSCVHSVRADILFDNGPPDPFGELYNMSAPDWEVFDEFSLNAASIITGFNYDVFEGDRPYLSTDFRILDAVGGNVLAAGPVVASRTLNSLTLVQGHNAPGYLHTVDGLSISLPAGTYVLRLTTDSPLFVMTSAGSIETIGAGLYQLDNDSGETFLRDGEHMSFRVIGKSSIPEPSSVLLFGTAALSLLAARRLSACRRSS